MKMKNDPANLLQRTDKMKHKIRLSLASAVLVSAALLLVSCCSCRLGSPTIGDLEQSRWRLTELYGAPVAGPPVHLSFDAQRKTIYGNTGCRLFSANYHLMRDQPRNIEISELGSSNISCFDDEQLYEQIHKAFYATYRLRTEGPRLLMLDTDGLTIGVLESDPAKPADAE